MRNLFGVLARNAGTRDRAIESGVTALWGFSETQQNSPPNSVVW